MPEPIEVVRMHKLGVRGRPHQQEDTGGPNGVTAAQCQGTEGQPPQQGKVGAQVLLGDHEDIPGELETEGVHPKTEVGAQGLQSANGRARADPFQQGQEIQAGAPRESGSVRGQDQALGRQTQGEG